jgi:hypothetical protein
MHRFNFYGLTVPILLSLLGCFNKKGKHPLLVVDPIRISIPQGGVPVDVDTLFSIIQRQSHYHFIYQLPAVDGDSVFINSGVIPLKELLRKIELATQTIVVEHSGLLVIAPAGAFDRRFYGRVLNAEGEPLENVIILRNGVPSDTTDSSGSYSTELFYDSLNTLTLSCEGYVTLNAPIPLDHPWSLTMQKSK